MRDNVVCDHYDFLGVALTTTEREDLQIAIEAIDFLENCKMNLS